MTDWIWLVIPGAMMVVFVLAQYRPGTTDQSLFKMIGKIKHHEKREQYSKLHGQAVAKGDTALLSTLRRRVTDILKEEKHGL